MSGVRSRLFALKCLHRLDTELKFTESIIIILTSSFIIHPQSIFPNVPPGTPAMNPAPQPASLLATEEVKYVQASVPWVLVFFLLEMPFPFLRHLVMSYSCFPLISRQSKLFPPWSLHVGFIYICTYTQHPSLWFLITCLSASLFFKRKSPALFVACPSTWLSAWHIHSVI